jgi:hypothetical protein
MSTRSIIVITGKDDYNRSQTTRIYKHSDGYPTGNLAIINNAIERGLRLVSENNSRFKDNREMNTNCLAGLVLGEATTVYGMGAYIEERFEEELKPAHLGNQWDLEWIYVIDVSAKTVNIYGGGYTGKAPQHALRKGAVDPMTYIKRLCEDYQASEKKELKKLITSIEAWGFKINPAATKKLKRA